MQTVTAGKSSESVQSLVRGLSVLRAFGEGTSRMSLTELSNNSDLPRATVRRSLITLVELGYVGQDERSFFLEQGRIVAALSDGNGIRFRIFRRHIKPSDVLILPLLLAPCSLRLIF